jgi:hypothetical protein
VRFIGVLALLLGTTLRGRVWAQAPTPTPNGQYLCSGGARDGQPCNDDGGCAPSGVCVIMSGICDGGSRDGNYCDCAMGTCTAATPVCSAELSGVCQGGPYANACCDVSTNCADGAPCVATQKVCVDGNGQSCLRDSQCAGTACQSTAKFCSGGDYDRYPCAGDSDCANVNGSGGGACVAESSGCTGDCDASGDVTVAELIVMVNIALGNTPCCVTCAAADPQNTGSVIVTQLIAAVNNALSGCQGSAPTGEYLCSAGPHDGQACNGDGDCAPGGACVAAQGICGGGGDDGNYCDCAAGNCVASTPVCSAAYTGVCQGGPRADQCCDVTAICSGNAPCVASQKVCLAGIYKGYSCLNDAQCSGSSCRSTGKVCNGSDSAGYSCVDSNDCINSDGSVAGTCDAATSSAASVPAVAACVQVDQCPL